MHVKSVELSHFKSFGGTTRIPLLSGFTVISGPNGSGKSNILDALLFALGLSSSKGMRAERLPDLVNQNQSSRRSTVEASVTVVFDISDVGEALLREEADDALPLAYGENGNGAPTNGNGHQPREDASQNGHAKNGHGSNENGVGNGNGHGVATLENIVPLPKEWSVTRRLRVTAQGTYTSNYYINGEACTLGDLHEQLQRFRIYPEGYNVVLQGDVTSIISMNSRERREIIDELAGVAAFDRKIDQAKQKLDAVKDREERFRIVERELIAQLEKLALDRQKAEKYQKLKTKLQEQTVWEIVLAWQEQQRIVQRLMAQIAAGDRQTATFTENIQTLTETIQQATAVLEILNAKVKALGEDDHLALQAKLATQEAELRQLQRQDGELTAASRTLAEQLQETQRATQTHTQDLHQLDQQLAQLQGKELTALQQAYQEAQQTLERSREAASEIADASQSWVQAQTQLRHEIETLRQTLDPQRAEQVRLQERTAQLEHQIQQQVEALDAIAAEMPETGLGPFSATGLEDAQAQVQKLAQAVSETEAELNTQRQTQTRLIQEQRDKQRQLDKLEAQVQAMQESQGTQATKVLLDQGLPGICGLVAELGKVDPRFQLALEIAAGSRLGYLVVEDDRVAASGIQLLKQRRAGRATFLPLNAIRPPRFKPLEAWKRPGGFVDYAVNLIDCEPAYQTVFAYVFGSTVVFETLGDARQNLGQFRMVTLDGEILETSGAMTGGSMLNRQGRLHFGTVEAGESQEAIALRQRLQEIDQILDRCTRTIATLTETAQTQGQALIDARQHHRELQLHSQQFETQLQQQLKRQTQAEQQRQQYQQELTAAQTRLQSLVQTLPALETQLSEQQQALADLEQSQTHSEWQQAQVKIRALEAQVSEHQQALQAARQRLQTMQSQQQRLQEKIQQSQAQLETGRQTQQAQINQQADLHQQQTALTQKITQTQAAIAELDQTLAAEKNNRDRAERELKQHQVNLQQLEWEQQKLQETQQDRRQQMAALEAQLETQQAELPDPLPEIPEEMTLEKLRQALQSLKRRLEAMEPVNMLALEEYQRTEERLSELTQKLETLEEERTELLLRIENFTTLRCQAFREAFDAVNENFKSIFATLSDGDGHLQLDDPQDPFNGGLNLVAHPKGKPVRRLASMSGGEKSLTALSFIFALQRYRPSPFYAFDEVDMFLDGANVERLAKMIKHQAQQAQFMVVSLRRPMIESAQRTIGVTQARGAYTQVLGIDLQASASV
ncbi:MAG: chromosome segregation protein SMC [Cyanobacteria bacterium P01_A01_bin.123]